METLCTVEKVIELYIWSNISLLELRSSLVVYMLYTPIIVLKKIKETNETKRLKKSSCP